MVCTTHTHHIATSTTGNMADRGTTSVVISGHADSSWQTESSEGTRGDMSADISQFQSIEHFSPAAELQWAELPSSLLLSIVLSTVASSVASSHTWSDVVTGDGSSVAAGSGSPSTMGSGYGSAQRGDGGLGSGSRAGLVSSSTKSTVSRDL